MKKGKVISVINFKGGVGKSTITFNLGAELSEKGYKVLLVDFDGQGNLTKFTGIEDGDSVGKDNIITALNEVMLGNPVMVDPIYSVSEFLEIMPCDIRKEDWINRSLSVLARETLLKRYLDQLKERKDYDYILIDNAPSINLDFQNSLVASDSYIVVTEAEVASADGIQTIYNIIRQVETYFNPELKATGIVINKVENRTNLHNLMSGFIKDAWGDNMHVFNTTIPKSIIAGESALVCTPICKHNPSSKIGEAFKNLAEEFIERSK